MKKHTVPAPEAGEEAQPEIELEIVAMRAAPFDQGDTGPDRRPVQQPSLLKSVMSADCWSSDLTPNPRQSGVHGSVRSINRFAYSYRSKKHQIRLVACSRNYLPFYRNSFKAISISSNNMYYFEPCKVWKYYWM
ncbi:hypothetical protein PGT21_026502 [Puccinia graminis f. sp. tritici]|uniref:Uncharacterized protein n=1 Tax=Puccinia graminis f. sp. tritici TaxID=56615 RepID=A0A5B0Q6I7_PUCGR|nr:hypothetical protein PGT21_026502 [Puccinia graminis f. sp. tritici]KAA1122334.1 hypothetical protein PGTUg99_036764 [Puccinia graminis f. sp. tritici]